MAFRALLTDIATGARRRVMAALPLLATAVAAAGGIPAPSLAKDGELAIGITQYPSTLNPLIDAMSAKSYVLGLAFRPLTTYDADWKLVCLLCTELPSIENGRAVPVDRDDGKRGIRLTYTIRPDATWGDGRPVTTEDVLFSYEVGRNPLTGVPGREVYDRIDRIDVQDEKTFTLHLNKLIFNYAANTFDLLPAHLERAAFAGDPAQYRTRSLYVTDPTNPGLYNGPYRIADVVPGSHIALAPNPTWKGAKPPFNRVIVRTIENTAALEANLLSGQIDMIAGEVGISLDQALAFEKRNSDRFAVTYKPGLFYEHIDLNLDNPMLRDRRVRRALLSGIDRETINRKLFAGRQPVANGFVSPLDWVHTDDVERYPYDPSKAKALLDEAGWKAPPGGAGDGIRVNAKGERLAFDLSTTAGNRSREAVVQVIQSQWRQLGVDARIRNEQPRVLFGETLNRRNFGAALFAWISAPESPPRTTLRSTEIPRAENGYGGQNFPGFANPEMDGLIDAIEIELDREKRAALWRRVQQIYAAELPVLPLYFRADPYILPKWLKGVSPTGHLAPTTLWVETWRNER
jgi:peptide/nickel transport system substrate-binding protein